MKKRTLFSLSTLFVLTALCCGVNYLLLKDNIFHSSIKAIIDLSQHLTLMSHLLVVGLLPIYIGMVVFGAVSIVMYVRSTLQQMLWPIKINSKRNSV